MKRRSKFEILGIGLAIFSMFFGAGNLIFPLQIGLMAGNKTLLAMFGFLITGVFLPLIALVTIILFDGNYKAFFGRLGKIPGTVSIFCCMLIIGPLYIMPRIVTFSHIMIAPFLWNLSLPLFAILFLAATFLGCYKENKILDVLGKFVSPLLLIALTIIICTGFFHGGILIDSSYSSTMNLLLDSIKIGYNTLDVIAAIFFCAIVLTVLRKNAQQNNIYSSTSSLAKTGFKAGLIGLSVLGAVYVGMGYLGALYGKGFENLNAGELFSILSFKILGGQGAIIIATAVIMACYSTIVPLAAVVSDYVYRSSAHVLGYIPSLIACLVITGVVSTLGLTLLMDYAQPVIEIIYPGLIVLMLANLAYKTIGFTWVKLPVIVTVLVSVVLTLVL